MDRNDSPSVQRMKQRMAGIFDRAACSYGQEGPPFFQVLGKRLFDLAAIAPGARVLDVATGTGIVLVMAAEAVGPQGHVVGTDLSEGMVAAARQQAERCGLSNVEVVQMDAEHLDWPDGEFDHVVCGLGLFLFPQPAHALREFHRVLTPGGRVAVTTFGALAEQTIGPTGWVYDTLQAHMPAEALPSARRPWKLARPTPLVEALTEAGFVGARVVEDAFEFTFATEEQWWTLLYSTAIRAPLETIEKVGGPAALSACKADVFDRIQAWKRPDGIHFSVDMLTALASKP